MNRLALLALGMFLWLASCSFSPAFAQGASCAKPAVLFVLNTSAGMNTPADPFSNQFNKARLQIAYIASQLDTTHRLGLAVFSQSIRTPVPLGDGQAQTIGNTLFSLSAAGPSNHVAAFTTLRSNFLNLLQNDTSGRSYTVVLVTNGTSDDGAPGTAIAALRSLSVNGRAVSISTYVAGGIPGASVINLTSWATSGGTSRPYLMATLDPRTDPVTSALITQLRTLIPPAQPEICDGKDNNCDGSIDETFPENGKACQVPGTSGPCAQGNFACAAGKLICQAAVKPQPETCNNQDDDCDGQIDNGLSRTCQTACGTGTEVCTAGTWAGCTAPLPQTEICDGKDNNCDGKIDEGCTCTAGQTRPCGLAIGECKPGTQACVNGQWSATCQGEVKPTPEICDNKDNNCDGSIDENLTQPCQTACGTGSETCTAGKWGACTSPQAKPEICDGQDNDCDGQIDEGCPCRPGQTQVCGSNVGECRLGFQTCGPDGQWGGTCVNEQGPVAEICDGKDNNCDGKIDDNLTQPCKNACGEGKEVCQNGVWTGCDAPQGQPEVCDGKDNDCDGKIDESLTQACYTGPAGTQGIGLCKAGTQTCNAGVWSVCTGEVKPATEICDGKDNDCDGQIDDGLTRSCYTGPAGTQGVGLCKAGTQTCTAGAWGVCTGEVKPATEICDGKDNNCDSKTDETFPENGKTCQVPGTSGPCAQGNFACAAGKLICQAIIKPTAELCNNIDDDCNGKIDDGLTRPCKNACGEGKEICVAGKWGSCDAPLPKPEVCGDGLDNNCDGKIDENCPCKDGETRPCGFSIGECKPGIQVCVGGVFSSICQGEVKPTPEDCDGKDNDCNGQVDEGLTTRPCKTACGIGTEICRGGWVGCSAPKPQPELCDLIDNDCDGQIDNNARCPRGTLCIAGRCSFPEVPVEVVHEEATPERIFTESGELIVPEEPSSEKVEPHDASEPTDASETIAPEEGLTEAVEPTDSAEKSPEGAKPEGAKEGAAEATTEATTEGAKEGAKEGAGDQPREFEYRVGGGCGCSISSPLAPLVYLLLLLPFFFLTFRRKTA